jgi:hypothetical protein
MIERIIEAIERAVPGVTEGTRFSGPPDWLKRMSDQTDVWLGGLALSDVEVAAVRRDGNGELEQLVVTVLTDDDLAAQTIITIEPDGEDGRGRFDGWAIVRLSAITGLDWARRNAGPRTMDQLTATFAGFSEPVVIPAELDYDADPARFTKIFRLLRGPWIEAGASGVRPRR